VYTASPPRTPRRTPGGTHREGLQIRVNVGPWTSLSGAAGTIRRITDQVRRHRSTATIASWPPTKNGVGVSPGPHPGPRCCNQCLRAHDGPASAGERSVAARLARRVDLSELKLRLRRRCDRRSAWAGPTLAPASMGRCARSPASNQGALGIRQRFRVLPHCPSPFPGRQRFCPRSARSRRRRRPPEAENAAAAGVGQS